MSRYLVNFDGHQAVNADAFMKTALSYGITVTIESSAEGALRFNTLNVSHSFVKMCVISFSFADVEPLLL